MRAEPTTRPPASNGHQATGASSGTADGSSGELPAGPDPVRSGELTATNSHGKPAGAPHGGTAGR